MVATIKRILIKLWCCIPVSLRVFFGLKIFSAEHSKIFSDFLKSSSASKGSLYGKKILIWSPGGMPELVARDAMLNLAFRARGIESLFVICDGAQSACILRDVFTKDPVEKWNVACAACVESCSNMAKSFAVDVQTIGKYVNAHKRQEFRILASSIPIDGLKLYRYRGIEVGALAISSFTRFAKGENLRNAEKVIREYVFAGLLNTEAAFSMIEQFQPDRVYLSHGCYVDFGSVLAVAESLGIPAVVWGAGYLPQHQFIHTMVEPGHRNYHMLTSEAWKIRSETPLSDEENARLDRYFHRRYTQKFAVDIYNAESKSSSQLKKDLKLPENKPIWCVFSHLTWDNAFDYAPMAFENPEQWIVQTIQALIPITDVTWLIKIHPAEAHTATSFGVGQLIEANFKNLPPHIVVIPPTADVKTSDLYTIVDGGVTVHGTSGLEMVLQGKPVILAGEASYALKGFTNDGANKENYFQHLQRAKEIPLLSPNQISKARQFAYSLFIERQIPVQFTKPLDKDYGQFDFKKIKQLKSGGDPFIEFICKNIFEKRDFVLSPELLRLGDKRI